MSRTSIGGLPDALFSKVRQRVLGLIFGQPERSFYTSEIVRAVGSGTGAVQRELARLHRSGLISLEQIGKQKHYRANQTSPIFDELQSLMTKTVAMANPIREALDSHPGEIKAAFVYGSVAKGTDTVESDVDLMIIGDQLDYSGLHSALQGVEDRLRRKINPTFLSPKDWRRRIDERTSVIGRISRSPKIFVLGSEKDLRP